MAETVELYRPSNGTEGECFIAAWCGRCQRDQVRRDTGEPGDGCEIVVRTFAFRVSDPEYPREWREDGPSGPRCTAFLAAGADEPLDPAAVLRPLL